MAGKRISALTALTTPVDADLAPIVDSSAAETKHVTYANMFANWLIAKIEANSFTVLLTTLLKHATTIGFDIGGTEQLTLTDGKLIPTTDSDIELGDATHAFADGHFDDITLGGSDLATLIAAAAGGGPVDITVLSKTYYMPLQTNHAVGAGPVALALSGIVPAYMTTGTVDVSSAEDTTIIIAHPTNSDSIGGSVGGTDSSDIRAYIVPRAYIVKSKQLYIGSTPTYAIFTFPTSAKLNYARYHDNASLVKATGTNTNPLTGEALYSTESVSTTTTLAEVYKIDLGGQISLNQISAMIDIGSTTSGSAGYGFDIGWSTDDAAWTDSAEQTGTTGASQNQFTVFQTPAFGAVTARYIRLRLRRTSSSDTVFMRIYNIFAWEVA